MIRRAALALALAIVFLPSLGRAQQLDLSHGGPIAITASDGIEWRQNEQVVIARGSARAVRSDVTVTADRLVAHYRKKAGPPGAAPAPTPATTGANPADADTSGNEIYRVEADGDVHIFTATDHAEADHAIYDLDQAVLLMTGRHLKLTTPNDVLTARDDMEYWSQKHMAVARGDAVVVTNDGRRLAGDTLVAYTTEGQPAAASAAPQATQAAAHAGKPPAASADPLAASGKLQKVDAFGNVSVRTPTETVTGDRAVYVPDTGIARLGGNVRITRGQNQLNGAEAEVNLKTGISRLLSGNAGRVQGLVVPNDAQAANGEGKPGQGKPEPGKPNSGPAGNGQGRPALSLRRQASELRVVEGRGGLVARGVGKTYKKRPVVRNVSISVRRGEAVGLLGPNGAGKTTTFYMIVGLVRPDTGAISLDGADITSLPMYRRARLGIGYLPQEASVFRGLNVEQNVLAALEVVEPDPDRRYLVLDELLSEFGISHLRRTPALALSGGERRRVEIARALASQPGYILLDEPLAGIDPIAVGEIRELVSHLKDRSIGVLITDHNVRETLQITDRAYIMHDGQVMMEGRPQEVVAHEGVRRVYLGERFSL